MGCLLGLFVCLLVFVGDCVVGLVLIWGGLLMLFIVVVLCFLRLAVDWLFNSSVCILQFAFCSD